jgi:hypothetical protein
VCCEPVNAQLRSIRVPQLLSTPVKDVGATDGGSIATCTGWVAFGPSALLETTR